jgi:M6 family metalloprotease-like protein
MVFHIYKKIIPVFLFLFSFSNVYGAYLKNVPQTLTQPDGTIIHCFASGDEYHNWLHDSAGYTIIQNRETGYYVYADLSGEEVVASPYIVGKVNPASVGLKPNTNISPKTWEAKRKAVEQMQPPIRRHKAAIKNEGTLNNIAFFIAFADDAKYSKPYSFMSEMYNDTSKSYESNSLYNFYRIASYEKMYITTHFFPKPNGDTVMFYRDIKDRNYYRKSSASNPEGYKNESDASNRKHDLLKRTLEYFHDKVPTSINLDFNDDGKIDNVCFIVTGDAEGWNELLWPHRSVLYSDTLYINGKRVYDYNFQIENSSHPGVITHEMMHTLSAPDLYRYYAGGNVIPVGEWDLMASTNYSSPQGLGAYMKYKYGGWIDSIPEITSPGTYTLYPANGTSPHKTIYMLRSSDFTNDYLVFEYRDTTSNIFERNLPGSGLLIYRINAQYNGNAGYDGENIFDEVYIFRPGGTISNNGNLSRAHFTKDANSNRTTFGLMSNPYPFDSEGSPIGGVLITNVTESGDSIQFTVGEQIDTLTLNTNEIVVDCKGGKSQFKISANTSWYIVSGEPPWMSINKTNGIGDADITVQLSENTQSIERSVTVYVYPLMDDFSRAIKIRQLSCNSIEQIDVNTDINIFPNPAEERLTITHPQMNKFTDVSIYSIAGQRIPFSVIKRKENDMTIDISEFPSGVYYIKFRSEKQSTVKSFVVK